MSRAFRRPRLPWLLPPLLLALATPASVVTPPSAISSEPVAAEYAPGGGDGWQPAPAGAVLAAGDALRTAPGSAARAALPDGSLLRLGGGSAVRVEHADGEGIAVLQTGGIIQTEVTPAAAGESPYQVRTATALVSAPAAGCPWLRVDADGSVLVRHYLAGPTPPVPPQLVDEVYYAPVTVLGPDGPVDVPMPRTIAALRDLPPSAAPEDQPLAPCPFAGAPTDTPPSATRRC